MIRRLFLALIVGGALLIGGVLAYQAVPSIGRVSGKALNRSVTEETGGSVASEGERCVRHRENDWSCEVGDTAGSGGPASYRVAGEGRRCW